MLKNALKIFAVIYFLLVPLIQVKAKKIIIKNQHASEQLSTSERVSFKCPITQESNLGEIIEVVVSEAKVDGLLKAYPKELIAAAATIKSGEKTITVEQLKPIMPFILKRIAPYLLGSDLFDDIDYNAIIARAKRINDNCSQSINQDIIKPVNNKINVDLDGIIKILCLIQKNIDRCCKKLYKKIDYCCDEVINTITDCCDDLSNQIQESTDDINRNVDNCCDELSIKIDEIALETEEIIDTITQCCDDLSEQLEESFDELNESIEEIDEKVDGFYVTVSEKLDMIISMIDSSKIV